MDYPGEQEVHPKEVRPAGESRPGQGQLVVPGLRKVPLENDPARCPIQVLEPLQLLTDSESAVKGIETSGETTVGVTQCQIEGCRGRSAGDSARGVEIPCPHFVAGPAPNWPPDRRFESFLQSVPPDRR